MNRKIKSMNKIYFWSGLRDDLHQNKNVQNYITTQIICSLIILIIAEIRNNIIKSPKCRPASQTYRTQLIIWTKLPH